MKKKLIHEQLNKTQFGECLSWRRTDSPCQHPGMVAKFKKKKRREKGMLVH